MTLRLYLVRHGETEWTRSGQHTGRSDIPLTARGEDEAGKLARCLRDTPFTHVLSSPRQRAVRTCELAGLGSGAVIEPDLAEWDYGEFEGKRSAEICKIWPEWNVFQDGCPGGETTMQIRDRADRVIAKLGTLRGDVAIFAHGQFGCVLASRWIELPVAAGQHFELGPASLSILGYSPTHPTVRCIALWNADPALLRGR